MRRNTGVLGEELRETEKLESGIPEKGARERRRPSHPNFCPSPSIGWSVEPLEQRVLFSALSGSVIGTSGSYNGTSTIAKVFDGNLTTYFDAATAGTSASPNWAGLNLGALYSISSVSFAPRVGYESRMVGGYFQESNDPTFVTGDVALGTITATPADGFTSLSVTPGSGYQYVRYVAPAGAYGNIAELQFYGTAAPDTQPPTTPGTPTLGIASAATAQISWGASTDNIAVNHYAIYRGTTLAGTSTSTSFTDTGLSAGTSYSYTVRAVDAAGNASPSSGALSVTTPVPLSGSVIGTLGSYDGTSTVAKAFDGNPSTYFDAATPGTSASPNWAGENLGGAYSISNILFAPRAGYESRMVGGYFQGSNDPGFASGDVTLGTISNTPADGFISLPVTASGAFQYVRYVAPAGAYGNIAEMQLYRTLILTAESSIPPIYANGPFHFPLATFTQPAASTGTYSATIDWGDGTTPSSAVVEQPTGTTPNSGIVSGGHDYTTAGTYTAAITVTDGNGIAGTIQKTITVLPAIPSYVVPGPIGTDTALTYTITNQPHDALYQNELGIFDVDDAAYTLNGMPAGDNGNYTTYTTAALSSASDQVVFSPSSQSGDVVTVTVPAGERLGYYLVQDDTTAGYLASPPTYPSNYASDGQADPQNPYDGHPNVFFVDPAANADHFQHFIVLPGGAYGVEDSTGGGDEDFNDLVFSLSSLNVPVLTATPASDHTHIDVNWSVDTTNVSGYLLQREVIGTGTFTPLATITDPTATGFTDSTAQPGMDYGYRLKPYELVNGNEVFGVNSSIATAALSVPPPTIATAAAGAVSAAGTTIALSALGTSELGESDLTYTWSSILTPDGSAASFSSANGTNAAKTTTAAVDAVGDYLFQVTIADSQGLSTTDTVDVTVNQVPATLTGITTDPSGTTSVDSGGSLQYAVTGTDQFGNALDDNDNPAVIWTATDPGGGTGAGGDAGTIDNIGLFIPPTDNGGTITITASAGSHSTSTTVSVPTNTPDTITATESTDGSSVDVNWQYTSTLDNASGFDLLRATNGGTPTEIADNVDSSTTDFTDSSISVGNTYTYILRPFNIVAGSRSFGSDSPSASVTIIGMITATPSTDPVLVNSSGTGSTDVAISLPFTDSDPSATDTAVIDWGDGTTDSPETSSGTITESAGSGTVTGSHAYADGTYTATVTITNNATGAVPVATPIEVEVGGIPNAPTRTSATVAGGNVGVSWAAPSSGFTPTGYDIYGSADGGTTWTMLDSVDSSQTTDDLSGLTPSTSYLFHVTATNDFGESSASSASTATTSPAAPGAPSALTATLAAGNVVLNWTANTDSLATSYNIYESTDGGTTYNYFDSVDSDNPGTDAPATTYTATGLTAGTTPLFQVTAANASGESADTSSAGVAVPTGVTSVTATPSADGSSATVSWTTDSAALGYLIFRTPDDGSSSAQLVGTVTSGSTASYTDTTVTDTNSYTYTVDPYYTNPPPTTQTGSGTGSGSSGDDFTGTIGNMAIGNFTANSDGTYSATLSWSYQGSVTGFEVEEQNPANPGTNFYNINGTSVSSTAAGYTITVNGLIAGDTYPFRVRADHPDGTVSNYTGNATANIPAPPPPASGDSNPTLPAPTFSSVSVGGSTQYPWNPMVSFQASAPSNPNDPGLSNGYAYLISVQSAAHDPLGLHNPGQIGTVYYWSGMGPQNSTIAPFGTSGESYTYTGSLSDNTTGTYSPQSAPFSVKFAGTLPPKLSLTAGKPDASGNVIFTWTPPAGIASGSVKFYRRTTQNGIAAAVPVDPSKSIDVTSGHCTFNDLPVGTNTYFAVYGGQSSDESILGYSPYSNNVQIKVTGGPPAAPTIIGAFYDASVARGHVKLSWTNSSNNEDGYDILRSDGKMFHVNGSDNTTYTDTSLPSATSDWPWWYEVRATSQLGDSPFSELITVNPTGGPDITQHLLLIANAIRKLARGPKTWRALRAGFDTSVVNQSGDWDITRLSAQTASTSRNSGILPNGQHTVTVNGLVFWDPEVNYWLYGVWASAVGANYQETKAKVFAHASLTKEGPFGKEMWFDAGWSGNFNLAYNDRIPAASPSPSPPSGEDTGPLGWEVGGPEGHFSGADDQVGATPPGGW